MDFIKLAKDRYSVRKFSDRPVTQEEIDLIIQSGLSAPTGKNLQPQRILVLNTQESMDKLRPCTKCHFGAPAALLICYDKNDCWIREAYDKKDTGEIDVTIVATQMMLQMTAMGMGSTFVMYFDPDMVEKAFEIPENYQLSSILVFGHPAEDSAPIALHEACDAVENMVFYDKF